MKTTEELEAIYNAATEVLEDTPEYATKQEALAALNASHKVIEALPEQKALAAANVLWQAAEQDFHAQLAARDALIRANTALEVTPEYKAHVLLRDAYHAAYDDLKSTLERKAQLSALGAWVALIHNHERSTI